MGISEPQRALVSGAKPALPPSRFVAQAGIVVFRHGNVPVRVDAVDAEGRHGVHRKAVYPPVKQDAEGGAKPGGGGARF